MKKSLYLVLPLAAMAVVALAQPVIIAATHGRGVAENADGKRAEFRFEARKANVDGTVRTGGNFEFSTAVGTTAQNSRRIMIRTREIAQLGATIPVAEFSGPGVMVIRNANGRTEEVRGRVEVMVRDEVIPGQPNPNNEADDIRVRFVRPNSTNDPFVWEGSVKRGDIVVRVPTNP